MRILPQNLFVDENHAYTIPAEIMLLMPDFNFAAYVAIPKAYEIEKGVKESIQESIHTWGDRSASE